MRPRDVSLRDVFRRRHRPDVERQGPVARASRGEWRSLPPLQRLIPATTTIDARFDQRLVTAGSPSFLGELGHLVASDGPSGLMTAVSVPRTGEHDAATEDSPSPTEVSRRIEYGIHQRTAGRFTAPTPTLSRAPDLQIERQLAAIEPDGDSPHPDTFEIGWDDHDSDTDSSPVGADRDRIVSDDGQVAVAHDDRSAPLIGSGHPLVDASPDPSDGDDVARPTGTGPPFAGWVDRTTDASRPGSAPTDAAATPDLAGPADASAPDRTPLQRRTDPTTADAGAGQAALPVQRPAASHEDSGAAGTRSSADVRTDIGDEIAPVLSRSIALGATRLRIGSPIDDVPAARSVARSVQRSAADTPLPVERPERAGRVTDRSAPPGTPSGSLAPVVARATEAPVGDVPTSARPPTAGSASAASDDQTGYPAARNEVDPPRSESVAPLLGVPDLRVPPGPRTSSPSDPLIARSAEASAIGSTARARLEGSASGDERFFTVPAHRPALGTTRSAALTSVSPIEPAHPRPTGGSVPLQPLRPVQRRGEPFDVGSSTPSGADGVAAPILAVHRTLGLDGWAPGRDAGVTPAGATGESSPIGGPGGSVADEAALQAPPLQRAPIESVGGRSSGNQRRISAARGPQAAPESGSVSSPLGPATASLPASIVNAVDYASEVTPVGLAALEASTAPRTDSPVVQRFAAPASPAPSRDPVQVHAEAAWLPTELQRATEVAVSDERADGDSVDGTSPLAGASEADVIGLMRTMYPHLRRRLTRDLLLDRERVGHRTDIRF